LLDKIGRARYNVLREHLVKIVAQSIWSEHPEAKTIRAVFGSISLPSVIEFEQGKRIMQFLWVIPVCRRLSPEGR
jgi:hypothetical protein